MINSSPNNLEVFSFNLQEPCPREGCIQGEPAGICRPAPQGFQGGGGLLIEGSKKPISSNILVFESQTDKPEPCARLSNLSANATFQWKHVPGHTHALHLYE